MKVGRLKELLKNIDNDRIIVLSRDSEGNSYSPLAEIDDSYVYVAETTWSGEIYIDKLTPELVKLGYSERDVADGDPALVLWPIN